jgi:hypothetical protein
MGNVLQEDKAERNVFVFGGIHIAAQFVGGGPWHVLDPFYGGPSSFLLSATLATFTRRLGVPKNLNPDVVMIKSAEYRVRTDDSNALNRARDRRIFIQ